MNRTSTMLQPILDNRQLLAPIETEIVARTTSVGPIQAVIFDIYGTLVVSGSGDVGVADESDKANRIAEAFEAVGLPKPEDVAEVAQQLRLTIQRSNESRKSDACPKPEVDIVDIWHQTLNSIGLTVDAKSTELVVRLAAEYESRANPTWDMPGATQLLGGLAERGLKLGIVSNAQIFTVPLLENLVGDSLVDGGFDLNLCVFSNRYRQAKPGPRLFDVLCDGLGRYQIPPEQAIYVGNDMLNDVWAASQAGLKTAWFAGDLRSCRARQADPRCQGLKPDIVLTDLLQLPDCLTIE